MIINVTQEQKEILNANKLQVAEFKLYCKHVIDAINQITTEFSKNIDWFLCMFEFIQSQKLIGNTKTIEKYGMFLISNNYRKMHGLPMRRRSNYGKSKIKD